jgi:ABC-type dipeptide/oligopeptide/nickel transport system permease subunit
MSEESMRDAIPASGAGVPTSGTEAAPREIGFTDFAVREHRSLWGDAWRRLISSKTARLGMAIVILFALFAVLSHFFWEYDPKTDLDYTLKLKSPNLTPTEEIESVHPFGTDKLGRDIFRRVAHGGWNSLRVGLVAVGISLVIGGLLGLMAGFYESMPMGWVGRSILLGGIGLVLGAVPAWISGQVFQALLFCGLGVAAVYLENLLAGSPARVLFFAGVGFLLGAVPALLVSTYTALVCGVLGLFIGGILALPLGARGDACFHCRHAGDGHPPGFPGHLVGHRYRGHAGARPRQRYDRHRYCEHPDFCALAALAVGVHQGRILFRHILPNTLSPTIVQSTMGLATAILSAAALGFLGLGAIPPEPEWGAMLGDSYRYLTTGAWWAVVFPGLAIMLSVLGFNLLGDGLRDALDPRLRL